MDWQSPVIFNDFPQNKHSSFWAVPQLRSGALLKGSKVFKKAVERGQTATSLYVQLK